MQSGDTVINNYSVIQSPDILSGDFFYVMTWHSYSRTSQRVLYGYSFTVLRTNSKQMKEKNLDRFKFPDELKEKLVTLVVYQNRLPKELSLQYGLPNAHMLVNWVNIYKKSLEKGAITLPPMQTKKKKDTPALKQRIKQLEKSLEKANVMIYGLNAMIDYAEKELKVPVRKKHGTK